MAKRSFSEAKTIQGTALDKFRQAAADRARKHDDIEREMKARHAAGKEDMKGSIDRLAKHLNKEETINEVSSSEVQHHFDKWTNSEHAPYNSDAGDDNKVHQSALRYLRSTDVPKENHEKLAMHIAHKFHGSGIDEEAEQIDEKNVPTSPEKWARAKAAAKSKFAVYPSAYANGWASKKYKAMGGGWKSVSEAKEQLPFDPDPPKKKPSAVGSKN
jgi:hypothetical protein